MSFAKEPARNHPKAMAETLLCAIIGVSGKMVPLACHALEVHLRLLGKKGLQITLARTNTNEEGKEFWKEQARG